MVILTRKVGQAIRIVPDADLDPATPIGELFIDGPISVILAGTREGQARMVVYSDSRFLVAEDEHFSGMDDEELGEVTPG